MIAWLASNSSVSAPSQQQLLLNQATMWQERNRRDMVYQTLNKLLRVSPNDAEALTRLALLEIEDGQRLAAQRTLERLQAAHPGYPSIQRIQQQLATPEDQPTALDRLRQLANNGQTKQALAGYRTLMQQQPQDYSIALEYWRLIARQPQGWRSAKEALAMLVRQHPDSRQLQLEWIRLTLRQSPVPEAIFPQLQALSTHIDSRDQALYLWRSALLDMDAASYRPRWFQRYLREQPTDTTIIEQQQSLQQQRHQRQQQLADPSYQALRELATLLDSDQPSLSTAEALANRAAKHGANHIEYLTQLARLRQKQQRYHEATELYRRLMVQAPSQRKRWQKNIADTELAQQLNAAEVERKRADQFSQHQNWRGAEAALQRALRATPTNPWLYFDLATIQANSGQMAAAKHTWQTLLQRSPSDPDALFAYATYLARYDDNVAVLNILETIPPAQLSPTMRELQRRVWLQETIRQARQLANAGYQEQARQTLQAASAYFIDDRARQRQLVSGWQAIGENATALATLQRLIEQTPNEPSLQLSKAELLLDAKQPVAASHIADALSPSLLTGELAQRLATLKTALAHARADQLEEAAQLARQQGEPEHALQLYRQAMANDIANETSAAAKRRHNAYVELLDTRTAAFQVGIDSIALSGTAGKSTQSMQSLPLQYQWPAPNEGKWFLRSEQVHANSGQLNPNNLSELNSFGSLLLCPNGASRCPAGTQQAQGTSVAAGFENQTWRLDLGTTPIGFPVQNTVGGVLFNSRLGNIGYQLDLSRRPLTGSVLTFAGTRDPNTDTVWGGVRATGLSLGLSHDQGGQVGLWGNAAYHKLTGQGVLSNTRAQVHGGLYWRILQTPSRQIRVGSNLLYWHFKENLNEFTIGHGGYFSPQSYTSLSLPVSYQQRTTHWSWLTRAAISLSHASTKTMPFFPTRADLQRQAEANANSSGTSPFYQGSPSNGTGYSLINAFEYQLTPRWVLGSWLQLERSKYYQPNYFTAYLRYVFASPAKSLPSPPEPFRPYWAF